jgi:ATP-dependent DNA helicase 2 subunit 2
MFVVDVSPSMGHLRTVELTPGPNDEKRTIQLTNLQWALKYVKHKVQQMVGCLHALQRKGLC